MPVRAMARWEPAQAELQPNWTAAKCFKSKLVLFPLKETWYQWSTNTNGNCPEKIERYDRLRAEADSQSP
jgi:hypothetical protein